MEVLSQEGKSERKRKRVRGNGRTHIKWCITKLAAASQESTAGYLVTKDRHLQHVCMEPFVKGEGGSQAINSKLLSMCILCLVKICPISTPPTFLDDVTQFFQGRLSSSKVRSHAKAAGAPAHRRDADTQILPSREAEIT